MFRYTSVWYSDSLNDRTSELEDGATRIGTIPPALTVPVVERSVGLADARHESDAGSFRGKIAADSTNSEYLTMSGYTYIL